HHLSVPCRGPREWRPPRRHPLVRGEAERRGEAGLAEDVTPGDPGRDGVVADTAHELDSRAALERAAERPVADEEEATLPVRLERASEAQHVLPLAQAAEAEERRAVLRDRELAPGSLGVAG